MVFEYVDIMAQGRPGVKTITRQATKKIGYSFVYIIHRKQNTGSVVVKDEKLVRFHFGLNDRATKISRVALPPPRRDDSSLGDSVQPDADETGLTEVWTGDGWPPADLPTIVGFSISPRSAYEIIARSKRLSLKHKWFCCRDDSSCYMAGGFMLPLKAKTAREQGIRVDGKTGAI